MFNQSSFKFSKVALAVAVLTSTLTLTGCGSDNKPKVVVTPDPTPAEPVSQFTAVEGHWNKTGYGQFLSIAQDSIKVYEFNQVGCMVTDTFSYEQADEIVASTSKVAGDKMELNLKGASFAEFYDSAENLPASCESPLQVSEDTSPIDSFDYFWQMFNDYYAFFAERGVDWQQMKDIYRPLVSAETTNEELMEVFSAMLTPLMDGHVSVVSPDGYFHVQKPVPMIQGIIGAAASTYRGGQPVSVEDMAAVFHQVYLQIQAQYIAGDHKQFPQESDFPTLIWGKTENNVGVLVINSMMDFIEGDSDDITVEGVTAAAIEKMDIVMAELADTDGMIVDVRNNEGGADPISMAIASYFATKDAVAFNKQAETQTGDGHMYSVNLEANDNAYAKPVYLITSQRTGSAAEIFTMAMKTQDHVTLVGEPTSGALSDVLDLTLPNGWSVSLSNEVYRDAAGTVYEVTGVEPDLPVPSYTLESLQSFKFDSYELALEHMDKAQAIDISSSEYEQQVEAMMADGLIPGLSVALVKDGEIVYEQGFGVADSNDTAVTPNTQFFLASVSKSLLGTTMAQVEADGVYSIEDEVEPLLGYQIEYPNDADFAPTFQHLVTHTSGIIDEGRTFLCSYYLVDSKDSLMNLFTDEMACEDGMDVDMGNFLQQYLVDAGDKYLPENFTSSYGMDAGQISHYSNIATGLAGFALEQASGKSLPQLTQEYVLDPLQMDNTLWSIVGIPVEVASRYYVDGEHVVELPVYNAITYPDGGAISSAHDLAKYMSAVMNEGKYQDQQVLKAEAIAKMLSSQTDVAVPERGVGYFWRLDGNYFSHNGGDPGVMTQVWADTHNDVALVILSNGDSFNDNTGLQFDNILRLTKAFARSH